MRLVIVPNFIQDTINTKLDEVLAATPDAQRYRDIYYHKLLEFFDDHGYVPDFRIEERRDGGS